MSSVSGLPPRTEVVGVPISMTSYDEVLELIDTRPADAPRTFLFCNVHSVMSARRDPQLWRAIADADVATSDGVPLVWAIRKLERPEQQRVYGPDLMEYALRHGVDRGWRHYLYGATEQTLDALEEQIQTRIAPGAVVAGRHAPPFRPLTADEEAAVTADIVAAKPDCLWVGLGMPKQELWIHRLRDRFPGIAVLGVGAAFDLLAGIVPQAPDFLQDRGLEWAYRLYQEPGRLWRRYAINNPAYVAALARQLWRTR